MARANNAARILRKADLSPRQHRDLARAFAAEFGGANFNRVAFYTEAGLRPHTVTNVYDGSNLTCRVCHTNEFIDAGRSLDHLYYECLYCGEQATTLSETGASA